VDFRGNVNEADKVEIFVSSHWPLTFTYLQKRNPNELFQAKIQLQINKL
jgi:hypothetical protein